MKKILKKSLVGFAVGVTILMMTYISVYFIADETTFDAEINQLHNITTLITQIVAIGITYYLVFVSFQFGLILREESKAEKCVFITLLTVLVLAIIINYVLLNKHIYSENIGTLNVVTLVVIYVIGGIYAMIINAKENKCIKKINQKLKEKS